MRRKLVVLLTVLLLLVIAMSTTVQGAGESVFMSFVMDGSGSIGSADFELATEAIAAAIENPACVPQDGQLTFHLVQFGATASTFIYPTAITAENVAEVAQQIRDVPYIAGMTNYEAGIDEAIKYIDKSTDRQVINFNTDGLPNMGVTDTPVLRDRAAAAGFDELDVEGIGAAVSDPAAQTLLSNLAYPQPGLLHPPNPWPPTEQGWVLLVENYSAFAQKICDKMQIMITPPTPTPQPSPTAQPTATPLPPTPTPEPVAIPEPGTVLMLTTGLGALGAYVAQRRRTR
jgi:hypothetical protein